MEDEQREQALALRQEGITDAGGHPTSLADGCFSRVPGRRLPGIQGWDGAEVLSANIVRCVDTGENGGDATLRNDIHLCSLDLAPRAPAKDRREYQEALRYLAKSPTAQKIIGRLERAKTPYRVLTEGAPFTGEDGYQDHTIYWVPTDAFQWKNWTLGRWQRRSPALCLLHEMGHAYHDDLKHRELKRLIKASRHGSRWTNGEEKRTIQEIENPAARQLGEPERRWHSTVGAARYKSYVSKGATTVNELKRGSFSDDFAPKMESRVAGAAG